MIENIPLYLMTMIDCQIEMLSKASIEVFALLQNPNHYNPFFSFQSDNTIKKIATDSAALLGGVCVVIGGGLAAWKAARGEDFSKQLIFAIVAFLITVIAVADTIWTRKDAGSHQGHVIGIEGVYNVYYT